MSEWKWVLRKVVILAHAEQIAEHGGASGIRDEGLLESALARPENLAAYGEPDIAELAASYAFGLARNHPFVDGNKRTAFVTAGTFLIINGYHLGASEAEAAVIFLDLASGAISEEELAVWFRSSIRPL
jgi:death-on-curing protein